MDTARFIPCLVKTVNNFISRGKTQFELRKPFFKSLDELSWSPYFKLSNEVIPGQKKHSTCGLYGTTVEFIWDDESLHYIEGEAAGFFLEVNFEVYDFPVRICFTTEDSPTMVARRIHIALRCYINDLHRTAIDLKEMLNELKNVPMNE